MSTVVSAINGLSGSSYNSAIESLDFNHTSASNKLNAQISSSNANYINQRIVALNSSLYSNEIKLASATNVLSDVSYDSFQDLFKGIGQTGSWGTFYGGEKDQNDITDIGVNGYEDSFIGLIFGYDTKSDDQTTGIAFTYQDGEITSDNNEGVSNYKLYAVSPYLHKSIDQQESVTLEASLNIGDLDWILSYQSRVGPLKWIGPSTEDIIVENSKLGKHIVLVPIAFVSEHSETLVELDIEYKELADKNGCKNYSRVPALGTNVNYIKAMSDLIINKQDYNFNGELFPPKLQCPKKFKKCPCLNYE